MAVITTQAAAETIANLITRTRRALGDTSTITANQRWSDAEIIDAMNLELYKMSAEWGLGNSEQAMTSTTLTYTAGSNTVALPSGPDVNPIFMVENYTDTNHPYRLQHVSFLEANSGSRDYEIRSSGGLFWSRAGSSIAVRPVSNAGITLRIWYLRAPYGTSTSYGGTDQQPWPVQHEELISLGAAIRLQEVDDELPQSRLMRYDDLWKRFSASKNFNRGPVYVRRTRRYQ